jgi:hypothetical protein
VSLLASAVTCAVIGVAVVPKVVRDVVPVREAVTAVDAAAWRVTVPSAVNEADTPSVAARVVANAATAVTPTVSAEDVCPVVTRAASAVLVAVRDDVVSAVYDDPPPDD